MSLKQAKVFEIIETHRDFQLVRVKFCDFMDARPLDGGLPDDALAYNYLSLGEKVAPGQHVLVNTTGIDLELGTGDAVFIVPDKPFKGINSYGHIVKLRYTPMQLAIDSVEEQNSPYHELLKNARSIEGMTVVCCELHSQMPLVAAACKHRLPEAKVIYIMNDAAALPLAFSQLVPQIKKAGLVDATISCGQAFGGELEAVNLYSALLTAHIVCKADLAIVAPGPGVAGTATAFGYSGIAQGEALNAVAALGGKPVAVLRLSWQDARAQHEGLSHHSKTVLEQVCLAPVSAPVPGSLSQCKREQLEPYFFRLAENNGHEFPVVEASFLDIDLRGIKVTTMGRTRTEDPEFFNAAFAAGMYAATLHNGEIEPDAQLPE